MGQVYIAGEEATVPRPLFSEDLFKEAVARERRRADRSGLALVVLLVRCNRDPRTDSASIFGGITDAFSSVMSEIDILGWFEQDVEMGIILPEVVASNLTAACESLEAAIRKELSNRFDEAITSKMSLRLRVYPEPKPLGEDEPQPVDPLLFPDLHSNQGKSVAFQVLKRGMDILGSLALIVILSPLLLMVAGLVKLSSPGPVLFRQVRIGQMMKPFMICKFRTMYANADHGIHHNYVSWFITSSGKGQEQDKNKIFKLTNDPRITPIGHFLRKTSLDELPQLWNVLVGEMSLVGPRPPLWYELQQYKPWHRHRVLEAKPGVTGLWQVSGRSRTTFDEMVRLDLRYARKQSLLIDIKILLETPKAVISGKGAC